MWVGNINKTHNVIYSMSVSKNYFVIRISWLSLRNCLLAFKVFCFIRTNKDDFLAAWKWIFRLQNKQTVWSDYKAKGMEGIGIHKMKLHEENWWILYGLLYYLWNYVLVWVRYATWQLKWQHLIYFIYLKYINTMCVCITQSVMITSLYFQVLGMYRIWCGIGVSVFIYDMMRDKSDDIQIRRVRLISFKKLNYRLV